MPEYVSLVKIKEEVQNPQELSSIWGDIKADLDEFETDLTDTYAILGEYDFLVIMDAPDRDAAFQAGIALERHGLDGQTMEIRPIEDLAHVVDDV